jgi:hypothetical protein
MLAVAAGAGLYGIALSQYFARMPLRIRADTPQHVAHAYAQRFGLAVAGACGGAMSAYALFWFGSDVVVYAVGVPFTLVALALILPSRRRLAADAARVEVAGFRASLTEAVTTPMHKLVAALPPAGRDGA